MNINAFISFLIITLIPISNENGVPSSPSSLTISNAVGQEAVVSLKLKNTDVLYSLGIMNDNFVLKNQERNIIAIKENDRIFISGKTILSNSLQLKGDLIYKKLTQWRMISYDSFNQNITSTGWSFEKTSLCKDNLYYMLGGHCLLSTDIITKIYNNLPSHSMIKIEGLFHFIGKWDQHTGYMKVKKNDQEQYIWSSRCRNSNSMLTSNLCDYQICSIGNVINISFKHADDSLQLIFGSTLTENPCYQSYGVSDIKIYVR